MDSAHNATDLTHFLEAIPPGEMCCVESAFRNHYFEEDYVMVTLDPKTIRVFCRACEKTTYHDAEVCEDKHDLCEWSSTFAEYKCRICSARKSFALRICPADDEKPAQILKIGEHPEFSPHTPPKLVELLGPESVTFFRGRRAEIQGLGLGRSGL